MPISANILEFLRQNIHQRAKGPLLLPSRYCNYKNFNSTSSSHIHGNKNLLSSHASKLLPVLSCSGAGISKSLYDFTASYSLNVQNPCSWLWSRQRFLQYYASQRTLIVFSTTSCYFLFINKLWKYWRHFWENEKRGQAVILVLTFSYFWGLQKILIL